MLRFAAFAALLSLLPALSAQQPIVNLLLPERTRLLVEQRIDLVVEVRHTAKVGGFRVTANGQDISNKFRLSPADLDCDGGPDAVIRADMVGFPAAGAVRIEAEVDTGAGTYRSIKDLQILPFTATGKQRNIVLFIGDAMANDYRDAARIVSRSVETLPGIPGMREGFFDRLMEMDRMPISGMVMNYAADVLVPDSATTATEWNTGNKPVDGALSALGDGTDCVSTTAATLDTARDNPRIETLWEYLRRRFNYRTGVVTTSYVTDATPGAHGAHIGNRDARFEVARQFLENPFLNQQPAFDVMMGAGAESFDPQARPDRRDLLAEFRGKGYRYVANATDLRGVGATDRKLIGLFRASGKPAAHSSGIRAATEPTMEPAYDKLGLERPASEPVANLGTWTDQPFLDLMTRKAIEVLSGPSGNEPFALMVEGGLIDKQSHSNHAAGTIWDVIELDKAVGVAREWANARKTADTLVIVAADHGQSMTVIGVSDVPDSDLYDRTATTAFTLTPGVGEQKFTAYKDINTNVRAPYGFVMGTASSGKSGPPAHKSGNITGTMGFPDYQDADGDGYPENREVNGKGRKRLVVGFRTGAHTGASLPLTAEGPGALLFTGYMDQTDLFFKMATVASGDTAEVDAVASALANPKYPRTIGK